MRSRHHRMVLTVVTFGLVAMMPMWQGCVDVVPGPLAAEAGTDIAVGLGQSVVLAGEAHGGSGGATFSWAPATGLSDPNAAQPTFTATTLGVQVYTLTVRDSAGNVATDTTRVEVALQPLVAEAGSSLTGSVGDTVLIQGIGSGGIGAITYQWTTVPAVSPAELLGASTVSPTFTPSSPGDYTFTLTVTDSEGFSDTDTMSVTILPGA